MRNMRFHLNSDTLMILTRSATEQKRIALHGTKQCSTIDTVKVVVCEKFHSNSEVQCHKLDFYLHKIAVRSDAMNFVDIQLVDN